METTVSIASSMKTNLLWQKGDHILATSGEDITAVNILTLAKVRTQTNGEGIGSTRAFRFRRIIMYTETGTVHKPSTTTCASTYVQTVRLLRQFCRRRQRAWQASGCPCGTHDVRQDLM